jgi:glycosyltransferase involved in cell wall biosynthesis
MIITIGIPAYNEEQNIAFLIQELLSQESSNYILKQIVVTSDGSDDKTVEIVKALHNPLVKIIDNKIREGVAVRQNQLFSLCDADACLLLNADILITDPLFISKIVSALQEGADLVSTNMLGVKTKDKFESIIAFGMELKNFAFENCENGNNVYTCHGAVRAFSKNLYSNYKFVNAVGDDADTYFYAVQGGYKYTYIRNTVCFIRCPSSYKDHLRQSTRNFNGMRALKKKYGSDYVSKSYKLPVSLVIKAGLNSLAKDPIRTFLYGLIVVSTYICSYKTKHTNTWVISESSKKVVNYE